MNDKVHDEMEDVEPEESDFLAYEISHYPADMTLQNYLMKYEKGQIVIPDFQRNYVWDINKASKLIESFLLGLPVPGVFLYKERKTNRMLVVDGQQRILSAVHFFRKEFKGKLFKLRNVAPKWEGKTYDDLDEADRLQLDDTTLRSTVVQQLDPQDDTSIYYIYERLNTGGVNLNPMEIRRCVYAGEFIKFLDDLNKDPNWGSILGRTAPDPRLKDVELILRILSLSEGWQGYEKPMKSFLNKFSGRMAKSAKSGDPEYQDKTRALEAKFREVCEHIVATLGEKPFHLHGRLNYAAMDSVIGVLMNMDNSPEDLKSRFDALIKDDTYVNRTSVSTSDEKVVKERFEKAAEYLR